VSSRCEGADGEPRSVATQMNGSDRGVSLASGYSLNSSLVKSTDRFAFTNDVTID
jgi:hypothetical protein